MRGTTTRRLGIAAVVGILTIGTAINATSATAKLTRPARSGALRYAVDEPVCAQPRNPRVNRCFAMQRVEVAKGTPGAYAFRVPNAIGTGVAGGYTPDDLAAAYHYNPAVNRKSQLVAIVDWFDDPNVLKDLNKFDAHYGLPNETGKSFRKVNENGQAAPLPKKDHASSVEITLDVQSVRGVCHTCRILLVEASQPVDSSIIKAENRAAAMGATEISNSFGAPEHKIAPKVRAAYNHPGIVITASTGDDGWFGWDFGNNARPPDQPQHRAQYPSSDPHVVSVGGTELLLNPDGSRNDESVWNENGPDDESGSVAQGAGGGGCSKLYNAAAWQKNYSGYSSAGCKGKRLNADISAIADPQTGFDIYDSYAPDSGGHWPWLTIGGTSLASPVTAALFALAGGSGGAAYPASTLYTNGVHTASAFFDVTEGGNSFCGGDTTFNCGTAVFNATQGPSQTNNPNNLGAGVVDCSFPRNGTDPVTPPSFRSECNAVTGFDGPTGIGAPNGLAGYQATNPKVTVTKPVLMRLHTAEEFSAKATETLSGITVTSYTWNWGDGKTTSAPSPSAKHDYTKPGHYTVTLTVTDSAFQQVIKTAKVTVGEPANVHLTGPSSLHRHQKGSYSTKRSTDPNTGAVIKSVRWSWGDSRSSTGTTAKHAYKKAGKYTIRVRIKDNSGVVTRAIKKVNVT